MKVLPLLLENLHRVEVSSRYFEFKPQKSVKGRKELNNFQGKKVITSIEA